MRPYFRNRLTVLAGILLATTAAVLSSCGGSPSTTTSPASSTSIGGGTVTTSATPLNDTVLPVTTNPIHNTSSVQSLKIVSVLVENNVDSANKVVADHLEIALTNTGPTELKTFEIFYTINDPTAGLSESYYTKLPDSFTIPAGGSRVVHFDDTGVTDHFPINKYSLYYLSLNALDVTVVVSSADASPQTAAVKKDAGGAEAAD